MDKEQTTFNRFYNCWCKMSELIHTTKIKRDKNFMYYLKGSEIIKFDRRNRAEKIPVMLITNMLRDPDYLYFISSNKEELLTIERAKRDTTTKAVKGLNWAIVEED